MTEEKEVEKVTEAGWTSGEDLKSAPQFKLFVAIPCYDKKVFVPCAQSLMNAIQWLLKNNVESHFKFEVGLPYVDMARNNLVRAFLESDCTDMVFVDADLGFAEEAFRDLALSNEAVIGGAYPKKQEKEGYAVLLQTDERHFIIEKNGVLEAEGLPTGFLKIKRTVFEQIIAAHPELAYKDAITEKVTYNFFGNYVKDGRWYGDDFGFCKLWNDLGGKCYVLPNITFIHCGMKNYEGNIWEYLQKNSPAPAPEQEQKVEAAQ